jgi:uncharacterized protein YjbK
MKQSLEIEFKTAITEDVYEKLMNKFDLLDKSFTQINHYFDTDNKDIISIKNILRIRQKNDQYKITRKEPSPNGTIEHHIYLEKGEALEMIENGFDASIINLPFTVIKIAELKTIRAKMPYRDGIIFLDKNLYYDVVDFEIEYESQTKAQGEIDFKTFLEENNIPFKPTISKTKRAYNRKK